MAPCAPSLPPRDTGDSSFASGGARLIYIFRGEAGPGCSIAGSMC